MISSVTYPGISFNPQFPCVYYNDNTMPYPVYNQTNHFQHDQFTRKVFPKHYKVVLNAQFPLAVETSVIISRAGKENFLFARIPSFIPNKDSLLFSPEKLWLAVYSPNKNRLLYKEVFPVLLAFAQCLTVAANRLGKSKSSLNACPFIADEKIERKLRG